MSLELILILILINLFLNTFKHRWKRRQVCWRPWTRQTRASSPSSNQSRCRSRRARPLQRSCQLPRTSTSRSARGFRRRATQKQWRRPSPAPARPAPCPTTRSAASSTEIGNLVIGNQKLIEAITLPATIGDWHYSRIRVIGNLVDSMTEPRTTITIAFYNGIQKIKIY